MLILGPDRHPDDHQEMRLHHIPTFPEIISQQSVLWLCFETSSKDRILVSDVIS
ncbi:hypothetical protein HanPSC8_Chr06g0238591 [Helianthus annuus]|nr:hypothetical protein HanPSC8_Chr06g0238591 [Helianthus annuus]